MRTITSIRQVPSRSPIAFLKIEFIETREKVDELLGKLEEMAGSGMIELQETMVAKPAQVSKPRKTPVPEHARIEGKAADALSSLARVTSGTTNHCMGLVVCCCC